MSCYLHLQSALGLEDQCTESHAPLRPLGLAWNSSDCFESFSPLNNDVTEGVITTRGNRMKFSLPLGPVVFKSIRFRSHRKRIDKRSNILRSIRIHTTCTVSMRFRLSTLKCSKTIEFQILKARVEEVGTFQSLFISDTSHWIYKKRQLHTVSLVPKLHAPHPWISVAVTFAI